MPKVVWLAVASGQKASRPIRSAALTPLLHHHLDAIPVIAHAHPFGRHGGALVPIVRRGAPPLEMQNRLFTFDLESMQAPYE